MKVQNSIAIQHIKTADEFAITEQDYDQAIGQASAAIRALNDFIEWCEWHKSLESS